MKMIPNCKGCECEIVHAYLFQKDGIDIALEGMEERKHCILHIIENET